MAIVIQTLEDERTVSYVPLLVLSGEVVLVKPGEVFNGHVLAVGDRYEKEIAAARAADAPYR